jgi:hypothetical protein
MMMANRRRGEIAATIDGQERVLCLTLGALAELEAAFEVEDLAALAQRFSTGRLSARDLTRVVAAGLRGGGAAVSDGDVAAMTTEGGIAGFAAIAVDLLKVTFGAGDGTRADP